jgi:hypothetical protein
MYSKYNLLKNVWKECKDRDRSVIRNIRLIAFFKKWFNVWEFKSRRKYTWIASSYINRLMVMKYREYLLLKFLLISHHTHDSILI